MALSPGEAEISPPGEGISGMGQERSAGWERLVGRSAALSLGETLAVRTIAG